MTATIESRADLMKHLFLHDRPRFRDALARLRPFEAAATVLELRRILDRESPDLSVDFQVWVDELARLGH